MLCCSYTSFILKCYIRKRSHLESTYVLNREIFILSVLQHTHAKSLSCFTYIHTVLYQMICNAQPFRKLLCASHWHVQKSYHKLIYNRRYNCRRCRAIIDYFAIQIISVCILDLSKTSWRQFLSFRVCMRVCCLLQACQMFVVGPNLSEKFGHRIRKNEQIKKKFNFT